MGVSGDRETEWPEKADDIVLAILENEPELEVEEFRELRDEVDDPTESREDILVGEIGRSR